MKIKQLITCIFCTLLLTLSLTSVVAAQETVTIQIEDLRQLRKLAADRDFQKGRADDADEQVKGWQASVAKWKALVQAETDRADRVQGGRVDELLKANAAYKDQAANDRQRLGELEFQLRKAKAAKKWYFAGGLVTGAAIGVYATRRFAF